MSGEILDYYFKRQAIFNGLDEAQIGRIHAASRQHILKRNARIVVNSLQSNRLYFLVKGKMKISDSINNSNSLVKDILYPGEMFGNISLNGFHGEEYAEALVNNTIVYCFGTKEFSDLLKLHHKLALNYADNINKKLALLKERYEIWTCHDTKTRFLYLLKKWAMQEGKDNGKNIILNNYLTLTDIAEILSVSRQFMYLMLKDMDAAGLVKYSRKKIELDKTLLDQLHFN